MRFEKQTFTTEVTLDGNEFIDCFFDGCMVWFHGGPFSLMRTTFNEKVRYGLGSTALFTVGFLNMVRSCSPDQFEKILALIPKPSPDIAHGSSKLN